MAGPFLGHIRLLLMFPATVMLMLKCCITMCGMPGVNLPPLWFPTLRSRHGLCCSQLFFELKAGDMYGPGERLTGDSGVTENAFIVPGLFWSDELLKTPSPLTEMSLRKRSILVKNSVMGAIGLGKTS